MNIKSCQVIEWQTAKDDRHDKYRHIRDKSDLEQFNIVKQQDAEERIVIIR